MHFCIVQTSRETLAFQLLLDDATVALSSVPFPDRDAAVGGIEELVASLREGVDATLRGAGGRYQFCIRGEDGQLLAEGAYCGSAAAADELLARVRAWAIGEERFRITYPLTRAGGPSRQAELVEVTVRYDLEQASRSSARGVELLRRARDGLFTAHINDDEGRPLLFLRGFIARYPRDEQVRSALQAAIDARRYDRREAEGRLYFVITARNGREVARSRWFTSVEERDAAIEWLVGFAPLEARRVEGGRSRRKVIEAGYDLDRASRSGVPGFEVFRDDQGHHFFHLNDEDGAALLFSHGYGSTRARDRGIKSLLRVAVAREYFHVREEGGARYFVIQAKNGRELARSRAFATAVELERAIAWILLEISHLGRLYGIRIRATLILAVPLEEEGTPPAETPAEGPGSWRRVSLEDIAPPASQQAPRQEPDAAALAAVGAATAAALATSAVDLSQESFDKDTDDADDASEYDDDDASAQVSQVAPHARDDEDADASEHGDDDAQPEQATARARAAEGARDELDDAPHEPTTDEPATAESDLSQGTVTPIEPTPSEDDAPEAARDPLPDDEAWTERVAQAEADRVVGPTTSGGWIVRVGIGDPDDARQRAPARSSRGAREAEATPIRHIDTPRARHEFGVMDTLADGELTDEDAPPDDAATDGAVERAVDEAAGDDWIDEAGDLAPPSRRREDTVRTGHPVPGVLVWEQRAAEDAPEPTPARTRTATDRFPTSLGDPGASQRPAQPDGHVAARGWTAVPVPEDTEDTEDRDAARPRLRDRTAPQAPGTRPRSEPRTFAPPPSPPAPAPRPSTEPMGHRAAPDAPALRDRDKITMVAMVPPLPGPSTSADASLEPSRAPDKPRTEPSPLAPGPLPHRESAHADKPRTEPSPFAPGPLPRREPARPQATDDDDERAPPSSSRAPRGQVLSDRLDRAAPLGAPASTRRDRSEPRDVGVAGVGDASSPSRLAADRSDAGATRRERATSTGAARSGARHEVGAWSTKRVTADEPEETSRGGAGVTAGVIGSALAAASAQRLAKKTALGGSRSALSSPRVTPGGRPSSSPSAGASERSTERAAGVASAAVGGATAAAGSAAAWRGPASGATAARDGGATASNAAAGTIGSTAAGTIGSTAAAAGTLGSAAAGTLGSAAAGTLGGAAAAGALGSAVAGTLGNAAVAGTIGDTAAGPTTTTPASGDGLATGARGALPDEIIPGQETGGGARLLIVLLLLAAGGLLLLTRPWGDGDDARPETKQDATPRLGAGDDASLDRARPGRDAPPAPIDPVKALEQARSVKAPRLADCPGGDASDVATGIMITPARPVVGAPVRIIAATFAGEQPLAVHLLDHAGASVPVELTVEPGIPSATIAAVTLSTTGAFTIAVSRDDGVLGCKPVEVTASAKRSATRAPKGAVWPIERAWTRAEEALYSAWIRRLFRAPPSEELTFARLEEVTADPTRNLLHDALGLGEDGSRARPGLRLSPDCADLPYFLRAYWAWKRRLPFAFRPCSRGEADEAPRCGAPRTNLEGGGGSRSEVARMQTFLRRTLAWGVHTGNGRTHVGDPDSDFYPVALDRRALRPGTIYADPYGHILMLVEQLPGGDGASGALLAIDGQPDGTITRKAFWEGTFLWDPERAPGTAGFKRFRPVALRGDDVIALDDAALARLPDHQDILEDRGSLREVALHDEVTALFDPGPWDPARKQRAAVDALHAAVRARVDAVARGVEHRRRSRTPIRMPRGYRVFETLGPWESYSTPGRDLRLLIAIDVVFGLPDRVRRRPELWALEEDAEATARALERSLDALLREPQYRFTYRRSDGSDWTLTLADLVARAPELERGYNPNDCPEYRWGAPEASEERSTCTMRAPENQRTLMAEYRRWFQSRRPPNRGT